ncbi:MAG: RNA polymerase sigma factor [Thermoleophilia bacterium]|nr:RNA polymerase sigma factor [Thermoleophilia bacterium]
MEPIDGERHKLSVDLGANREEDHLTQRALAGSKDAFESLFRIHHASALRVARSFVRSVDDAEDIVQESFVKAWRAMDRFDAGSPFGPWLRTIVANEARSSIRASARRDAAGSRLKFQQGRTDAPELSVEDPLLAVEARDELDQAIGALSPMDQRVIRLRYELGLSESEMATELEVPSGTVKSRLSRALVKLKEHLVVVILLLVAMAAVAVPPVRAAIERAIGITGAEEVISVPRLPEHLSTRPFDWGPVVDPDEAGRLNPFGSDLPTFHGAQPELRLRRDLNRPLLTLIYGRDTATIVSGSGPLILAKLVPRGAEVRQVQIPGAAGLWIPGGLSHALVALDSHGNYVPGPKTRIDSGVLALVGPDGRDYRVQTKQGLKHALDLASTLYTRLEK